MENYKNLTRVDGQKPVKVDDVAVAAAAECGGNTGETLCCMSLMKVAKINS